MPNDFPLLTGVPALEMRPAVPEIVSGHPRKAQIERALKRQNEPFLKAFKAFADEWTKGREFAVFDLTAAYDATDNPKPAGRNSQGKPDYRGIGGMIQKMVNSGQFKVVGRKDAPDGSGREMKVYRG